MKTAVEHAKAQSYEHLTAPQHINFHTHYTQILAQGYQANPPPEPTAQKKVTSQTEPSA
ncbi:MAG TPA: hypothetical protein VGN34_29495 [Ktedonobacteraceae bacterium]